MYKLFLPIVMGIMAVIPAMARDFQYTYEGQTILYTVIDEEAKTVRTKDAYMSPVGGVTTDNAVTGNLVLPSTVSDGTDEYTLIQIGSYGFSHCKGLTSVVIPNSVTSIRANAFEYCTDLKTVNIPDSVAYIDHYVFYYCQNLTSIDIPDSVIKICPNAFYYCCGLNSIEIPNSVKCIDYSAFSYCTGLTSVTIPNSVTTINNNAFNGCSNLTSVSLGSSVAEIQWCAFLNCPNIICVEYNSDAPYATNYPLFNDEVYQRATLYYPLGCKDKFDITSPWNKFINRVEKDFAGLEDVYPNTLNEDIDYDAPVEVYNLSGIRIGDNLVFLSPGLYIVRQGNKIRKVFKN